MNKKQLSELCNAELTIRQIALQQGCSFTNVRYWLRKFNLRVKRGARGKLPKNMITPRKCYICGETDTHKFYGNKRHICGKCHNEYVARKGREQAIKIRNLLGGKCIICGYSKYQTALDIHHIKPKIKDISFRSIKHWKWTHVLKELKQCVLLCKCCHTALHTNELSIEEYQLVKPSLVG